MPQLKKPQKNISKSFSINTAERVSTDHLKPIFSLEHIQTGSGYCVSDCQKPQKAAFTDALFNRSKMTWNQLKNADRQGLGYEKIDRNAIKVALPEHLKDDIKHFIAMRFNGKAPMVGYRVDQVFYILWLDYNFTLYKHN